MKLWVERKGVTWRVYLLLQVPFLIPKIPLCLKNSASVALALGLHFSVARQLSDDGGEAAAFCVGLRSAHTTR